MGRTRPSAHAAEKVLRGAPAGMEAFRAAAEAALVGAIPHHGNAYYKVELAKRTVVRALATLEEVES